MATYYFDHAATTPLLKEAYEAMLPYLKDHFGNPSSIYEIGIKNRKTINQHRARVAACLKVHPSEIYFTSGGSESNNWALKGMMLGHPGALITTPIEHHSVLHTAQYLTSLGHQVHYVKVDKEGRVDLPHLQALLDQNTRLVSVIAGNNEIGTIQPLKEIVTMAHAVGAYVHFDAVQTVGHVPFDISSLGVDLVSFAAHKFNGPKGIGALYIKKGVPIANLIHGGHQEAGLRSGTENVALIVGLTVALEHAMAHLEEESVRLRNLSSELKAKLESSFPALHWNGPTIGEERLPGNVHVAFPNLDSQELLYKLNEKGVYASSGSACNAEDINPSHVLVAIGLESTYLNGALRLTMGNETTSQEIDQLIQILKEVI